MTNLWRLFLRLAPYPASAKAVKADPWDGKARRGVAIALPSRCHRVASLHRGRMAFPRWRKTSEHDTSEKMMRKE